MNNNNSNKFYLKLLNDKTTMFFLMFFAVFSIFIFIVPLFFSDQEFITMHKDDEEIAPSLKYLFGTDCLGRDLFIRTLIATQISIKVSFISAIVAVVIGTLYGTVAGFYGGKTDNIMMRCVDGLCAIPFIFLAILFMSIFGRNFLNMFIAIACVSWLDIARIIRGQTIGIKNKEYIDAARMAGMNDKQIIFKHIIRNLIGSVILYTTLTVPSVLATSTFLGFLGLGIQPPMIGLGELISDGSQRIFLGAWWTLLFPCLFLFCILLSLFMISNGVKNSLSPKN
ncbi:MAG: ABC transporter permease [Cytophagales bacterium]|nr:ABC transporter permease [Cytophagales bacterium]